MCDVCLFVTDLCNPPQITQQVGRCGPVAGAVDSVDNILCSHLVDSLVRITCYLNTSILITYWLIFIERFLSSSLECVLVQFGLVHDLLHPRHHLFYETSQVLQEDEVLWCLRVSTINKRSICQLCLNTHNHMLCKNHIHLTVLSCLWVLSISLFPATT